MGPHSSYRDRAGRITPMTSEVLELKCLEALAQAFRLLSPLTHREEVYRKTIQFLKENTRAVSALLWLYRPEEDQMELVAAAGLSVSKVGVRFPRGQGVSWEVLERGEALFILDVSQDPRAVFLLGKRQAGAYLGVPLRSPEGGSWGCSPWTPPGAWGRSSPRSASWSRPWRRRREWSSPGSRPWSGRGSRRSATRPSSPSPWPWRPPGSPSSWSRRP